MKVVVNSHNDKVVGIHLVGAEVAEILQVKLLTKTSCSHTLYHIGCWSFCILAFLPPLFCHL